MPLSLKNKYQGQAIAIVMIVLVVAVIIALAVVSRTISDQKQVVKERSSDQSAEMADTALENVSNIPLTQLADLLKAGANPCNPSGVATYNLLASGCNLDSTSKVEGFFNFIGGQLDNYADNAFADIKNQINNQCSGSSFSTTSSSIISSDIKMRLTPIGEGDEIIIPRGEVFSFVTGAQPPVGACGFRVTPTPDVAGAKAGIEMLPIYYNATHGYLPYNDQRTNTYCLFPNCSGTGTDPNWRRFTALPATGYSEVPVAVSFSSQPYYLDELRLMAIENDVAVTYSLSTANCISPQKILKISVVATCTNNSIAKEITINDANWTPAIFDYVLYNGNGKLEFTPN